MITDWDQFNNPRFGQSRDPKTAVMNSYIIGNAGKKFKLYPFGLKEITDEETGKKFNVLRMPKEYEKRYADKDKDWQHICYNIIQCASNRHFWFQLTLQEKFQLTKFLTDHPKDRVYKMAKADYRFIDLYYDLGKFQFVVDDTSIMDHIFRNDIRIMEQYGTDVKYINYGTDYLLLESIKPWENMTYNKVSDRIRTFDIDNENIYIHDGQYIMNFTDPYGQQRW